MDIESIKESILEEMPTRPVKKFEFVSRYGTRVDRALTELIGSGDLVRVKRGLYSLSDKILDERSYVVEEEEELVFLPTKEFFLLVRSFYSQFNIQELIREGQTEVLEEVGYFKRSEVVESKSEFNTLKVEFLNIIKAYKLSDEGYRLISKM